MGRNSLRVVKIFLSSPSDLEDERKAFPAIIDYVNVIKARNHGVLLEAIGWENTMPGKGRPQSKINEDLVECELVIFLLWKRWGSSTNGYSSGVEEEYAIAEEEIEEGNNVKDIWFFFRKVSDDMLADEGEQLSKVLDFRNKIESEKKYLYKSYDNEWQFSIELLKYICLWLDDISPVSRVEVLNDFQRIERDIEVATEAELQNKGEALKLALRASKEEKGGNPTRAEGFYAKSISTYPIPYVVNDYGVFLAKQNLLEQAFAKFCYASKLSEDLGDEEMLASSFDNISIVLRGMDRHDEALESIDKAMKIFNKLNNKAGYAHSLFSKAKIMQEMGDTEKAISLLAESENISRQIGNSRWIIRSLLERAQVLLEIGSLEAAVNLLSEAEAICRDTNDRDNLVETLYIFSQALCDKEDLDGAIAKLEQANETANEIEGFPYRSKILSNLAFLYLEVGNSEDSYKILEESERLCRRDSNREGLARTYLYKAIFFDQIGKETEAQREAVMALDIARSYGLDNVERDIRGQLEKYLEDM